ncbi:MAG: hypothetical protein PHW02_01190 [bacterium]|nr:hypothetical protein [bacterium]
MKRILFLISIFTFSVQYGQSISLRVFDDMTGVKSASSEHFIYTYKDEISGLIPEIASTAEGVYDTLSKLMNTKVRGKINLIVTDQSDVPNGFSSPLLNPTVNIYLANPDASFTAKHKGWIEYVLTHELTHALHLSSTRPSCLAATGNSLFYAPNGAYPMYLLEGYTVYNESTLGRGRMHDTKFEALLRAMLLDSTIQPVGNAASYFNRFFPYSELPYLYGPYLMEQYREKHDSDLTRLTRLDFCSLIPFSVAFPDLFLHANMGEYPSYVLDEVYEEVGKRTDDLKRGMIFNEREKVSEFSFDNNLPACDDGKLYYIKSYPHREKRFVMRENKEERELFKITYSTRVSVKNGKIYLDMLDVYDNTNYFFDMYEYDASKKILEKLKETRRGFGGDAFGDTLLFIRNTGNKQSIIVYSLSRRMPVDSFSLGEDFKYYTLSAKDGANILISCYREGGFTDIVRYDMASKTTEFLTSDIATDHSPLWSKNKDGFYFISDRSRVNAVYFYDIPSKRITKVYNSLYNVSAFSVDEDNEMIYIQDISGEGDDIYSSRFLWQQGEDVLLSEIAKPVSLKKDGVMLKENGKYIFPKFSGPGAYFTFPMILPATYLDDYSLYAVMPFIMLNSDVSQSLTFYFSTSPNIFLATDGDVASFNYPTTLSLTSSYFKHDASLSVDFQRGATLQIPSGFKRYLPNVYSFSLEADIQRSKPFSSFRLNPAVSYERTSYAKRTGISAEAEISDYESSILSITPSDGYNISSKGYFTSVEDTSNRYDFGINIDCTVYASPVWNANLFLNANLFYSHSQFIRSTSTLAPFNFNSSALSLSFVAEEDGLSEEVYIRDFSYIKVGFVMPLMFINSSIPVKIVTSLPVRFDYISLSASQLAGYNIYEKKRELATRVSINMCINMSILSIYPGLAVTYNEITKKAQFGITATIK